MCVPRLREVARALAAGAVRAFLVLVAAQAVIRAIGYDAVTPLPELLAVTPYAALFTALLFVVALLLRLRVTGVVAVVLLLPYAAWLAPLFTPAEPGVAKAAQSSSLRVLTVNVLAGGARAEDIYALIRRERPDVVAVEELTPVVAGALDREGMRRLYPYRVLLPIDNPSGVGLYSRLPLERAVESPIRTTFPMPRATIEVDGTPVTVQAVHTVSPVPGDVGEWEHDLGVLRQVAASRKTPMIMLGDFNATLDHASFRRVLAAGLSDAHNLRGAGIVRTWPAKGPFPPAFHIDHVLVSRELSVRDAAVRDMPGSDHHAVVADLVVRER